MLQPRMHPRTPIFGAAELEGIAATSRYVHERDPKRMQTVASGRHQENVVMAYSMRWPQPMLRHFLECIDLVFLVAYLLCAHASLS